MAKQTPTLKVTLFSDAIERTINHILLSRTDSSIRSSNIESMFILQTNKRTENGVSSWGAYGLIGGSGLGWVGISICLS